MEEVMESPLPGKIVSVNVAVGDVVEEGMVVCTIEAMKMENPILSLVKGSVKELTVTPGVNVKTGDRIAVIEY